MEIRKLGRADELSASKIHAISFGGKLNVEEAAVRYENMPEEKLRRMWGSFTEDGEMSACVIDHDFTVWLDGTPVRMGGIGGVATLPEYRYGGAVKHIFTKLLRDVREEGEVVSVLYPFKHEFYRRIGYELCMTQKGYLFPVTLLHGYQHTGWAKRLKKEDDNAVQAMRELYEAHAHEYNLMVLRSDDRYRIGDPFTKLDFTMLLGDERGARAYLYYVRVEQDGKRILHVRDSAWKDEEGFRMILGYLARMSADYDSVRIVLPEDIPLHTLVPSTYEVKPEYSAAPMARLTNVQKALEAMRRPEGAAFTVAVTDDFLPENSGVYRVDPSGVQRTDGPADLEVSEQALTLLVLGAVNMAQALYRTDVKVNAGREALEKAFPGKKMYITDGF